MEDNRARALLLTAIAPIAWGSVYYVTRHFLPADLPLWGAVLRALPAGLLLLLIARRRPHGAWWWRSIVLGVLNVGGFFVLVFVAAQRLPTSLASSLMALSAAVMMASAWLLLGQRPRLAAGIGAAVGITGVVIMLGVGATGVDGWGVVASVTAMASSSFGFILAARWAGEEPLIATTSWMLVAGGAMIVPFALAFEGLPPAFTPAELGGYAYITVIATAVAYVAWFRGLRTLPAAAVGMIGLLNPVTGVVLGVLIASEPFGPPQIIGLGMVLGGIALAALPRPRLGGASSGA